MSGQQKTIQAYKPDPLIRNMMGSPTTVGEIKTTFLNGSQVVGPPYTVKSNKYRVVAGQSPQNIAGAFDDEAKEEYEEGMVMSYIARPWPDGRHQYIITADLVFCVRSKSTQSTGTATILNLGSFNVALREGYYKNVERFEEYKQEEQWRNVVPLSETDLFGDRLYKKWKKEDPHQSLYEGTKETPPWADDQLDGTSLKSKAALQSGRMRIRAGQSHEVQDELEENLQYMSKKRPNSDSDAFLMHAIKDSMRVEYEERQEDAAIYANSKQFWTEKKDLVSDGLRFLYLGSILDHFNYMGVVRSSTNDTGFDNRLSNNAHGKGVDLAITVAKKTFTAYNFWNSEMSIGDKLYLIVKRVKNPGDDSWGPFQVLPYCNGREPPSREDLVYEDVSGVEQVGYYKCIQTLSENLEGAKRPAMTRALACGLIPGQSAKAAYENTVVLDKLTCHVRV